MFETAAERWNQYTSEVSTSWAEGDPRHDLSGEVRDRLRQLDLILRHLDTAIQAVTPDLAVTQQDIEWRQQNYPRLAKGEITAEQYVTGPLGPRPVPANFIDAWDDVSIFTESFYFCAWRMVEVLRGGGPYSFQGLSYIKARAITIVRNHLIQHPEKKYGQNFSLGLVILSSGPVLRSLGGVARADSGRVDPLPDSKDQGLNVAAEELRDELEHRLTEALSTLSR